MMMIGVSAMSVLAMPAPVYCTAMSEHPTPTNGPKIDVAIAAVMLLPSVALRRSDEYPSLKCISSKKPAMPAVHRKKLAKNGSIHGAVGEAMVAS